MSGLFCVLTLQGAMPQNTTIHRLADEGRAVIAIPDLPANLSNHQRRS
jgi:hypothetical protein